MLNDPLIGDLVQTFVGRLPERNTAFQRTLAAGQWQELATLAHQMAGAAGFYGFPQLGQAALRLLALIGDPAKLVSLTEAVADLIKIADLCIQVHSDYEPGKGYTVADSYVKSS